MATSDEEHSEAASTTLQGVKGSEDNADGANIQLKQLNAKGLKEKKIGHRRVDSEGKTSYKKTPSSQLMAAIQLGIGHAVGKITPQPKRDLLYQDFSVVEEVDFPSNGSTYSPAHSYADFKFKSYAATAFKHFREAFEIKPEDFLMSLCNEPLRELSNPGASGSVFYLSHDDQFIIKTVQHKEANFLQKLLPGYYMNLVQNKRTLLPKFFGLYCYQSGGINIRFVVMNNILPSGVVYHEKFDLKGSTYKRSSSKHEKLKPLPTHKDLDFREMNPTGYELDTDKYKAVIETLKRDCRVLESFKIMDYSMLVAVHNIDQAARDRLQGSKEKSGSTQLLFVVDQHETTPVTSPRTLGESPVPKRERRRTPQRYTYSIVSDDSGDPVELESVGATSEPFLPSNAIQAKLVSGDRLVVYIGIIDILQSYRLKKKLEHSFKALVHDGDSVSVHRPRFYARRFEDFMAINLFHVKQVVPPKRKASQYRGSRRHHATSQSDTPALPTPTGEGPHGDRIMTMEVATAQPPAVSSSQRSAGYVMDSVNVVDGSESQMEKKTTVADQAEDAGYVQFKKPMGTEIEGGAKRWEDTRTEEDSRVEEDSRAAEEEVVIRQAVDVDGIDLEMMSPTLDDNLGNDGDHVTGIFAETSDSASHVTESHTRDSVRSNQRHEVVYV